MTLNPTPPPPKPLDESDVMDLKVMAMRLLSALRDAQEEPHKRRAWCDACQNTIADGVALLTRLGVSL